MVFPTRRVNHKKTSEISPRPISYRRKSGRRFGIEEMAPMIVDDELDVSHHPFTIVGIGASAGGLEALELFLKNLPPRSNMAYVIIQHLDPTHKGILVELLQRSTPMLVTQASDRLKVEPETVYVIPPNKDLSILHGVLHLFPPSAPRGPHPCPAAAPSDVPWSRAARRRGARAQLRRALQRAAAADVRHC